MNRHRTAVNAALALAAIALSLFIGEVALRTAVTLPLTRVEPEVRYRPDPVRRFSLLPNQASFTYGSPATIDERGFRLNSSSAARYGRNLPTVLALGDSFTFRLGVWDEETWPAQLESRLRARHGLEVAVVNAGTISYGVFQELDLLRSSGLHTRPTIVVHGLYWNDFMSAEPPSADDPPVLTPDGRFVWDQPADTRSPLRRLASWALSRSTLLFSVRQAVNRSWGTVGAGQGTSTYGNAFDQMLQSGIPEEGWSTIEGFYQELQRVGAERSFETMVVIMPVNAIACTPAAREHPYAVQARQRLGALFLDYVDGFEVWEQDGCDTERFLPQGPDAHLNRYGYELLAGAIADRLAATPALAARLGALADPPLGSQPESLPRGFR